MKPTEILSDEHRVIEQVLSALEKMADESEATAKLDVAAAKDAVDFFRNFADRCHHGKEEARLFPLLEQHGFSPDCGPTAVMRLEHEQGRAHVRAMLAAAEKAERGDAAAVAEFVEHARGYVGLLREHIQKEDHCLFAMANSALSAKEQEELLAVFDKVEHEEMGEGTHEKYLGIAEKLAERYGVARVEVAHHHCCHH